MTEMRINVYDLRQRMDFFPEVRPQLTQLTLDMPMDKDDIVFPRDYFDEKSAVDPKALLVLLEEYSLSEHFAFLLILCNAYLQYTQDKRTLEHSMDVVAEKNLELFSLLRFIATQNIDDLVLEVKSKTMMGAGARYKIRNQETVREAVSFMKKYAMSNSSSYLKQSGLKDHELTEDYLSKQIEMIKGMTLQIRPGRKMTRHFFQEFCFRLQEYLQVNTLLQASNPVSASDEQCRFIFQYMVIVGFIKDDGQDPEDYIRESLSRFKEAHPNISFPKR